MKIFVEANGQHEAISRERGGPQTDNVSARRELIREKCGEKCKRVSYEFSQRDLKR